MRILYTRIMQVTACSILLSACVSQPSGLNKYVPGLGEIMGQISMRHTKLKMRFVQNVANRAAPPAETITMSYGGTKKHQKVEIESE